MTPPLPLHRCSLKSKGAITATGGVIQSVALTPVRFPPPSSSPFILNSEQRPSSTLLFPLPPPALSGGARGSLPHHGPRHPPAGGWRCVAAALSFIPPLCIFSLTTLPSFFTPPSPEPQFSSTKSPRRPLLLQGPPTTDTNPPQRAAEGESRNATKIQPKPTQETNHATREDAESPPMCGQGVKCLGGRV